MRRRSARAWRRAAGVPAAAGEGGWAEAVEGRAAAMAGAAPVAVATAVIREGGAAARRAR